MRLVPPSEAHPTTGVPYATQMTGWRLWRSRIASWWVRNVSRRLPRLVWYGQEIDVIVTFTTEKLTASTADEGLRQLFSGVVYEAERALRDAGIAFDAGIGLDGRDWEWDWSLKGPISVRFKERCRTPERRRERPRARLVPQPKATE